MKVHILFLASVFLTGIAGASAIASGANDPTYHTYSSHSYDQTATWVEYCHLKLPAIREQTLGSDRPQLKDSSKRDVVDFYGPCDEDPVGYHQIQEQRLEELHHSPADCC